MSTKARSPTAHILRNSRLFALPRPLPLPRSNFAGGTQDDRISETATLPYPVQQAIVTAPSSLQRGDWGVKRSLPLRSTTKTSTPLLKINAVDTREFITDFSSASDLTISLRKIQELNLPVTASSKKLGTGFLRRRVDVFDPEFDHTDRDAVRASDKYKRWKFKGPWVAGMAPGEFDAFVEKQLKPRQPEFMAFVRERSPAQILAHRRAEARQNGQSMDDTITEQDIDEHIRKLRNEYDLNSPLARLIAEFLDLPENNRTGSDFVDNYKAISDGAPTTHPSAGLSYLRSDAFLDNHPLLGPQADHAPVEARILGGVTRYQNRGTTTPVGVAGMVANAPKGPGSRQRSIPPAPDNSNQLEVRDRNGMGIGLGTPGGNRLWVSPTTLEIDAHGHARLDTANASTTTIGVHTGRLKAPDLPAAPRRTTFGQQPPVPATRLNSRPIHPSVANRTGGKYGLQIGPRDGVHNTSDLIRSLTREIDAIEAESQAKEDRK